MKKFLLSALLLFILSADIVSQVSNNLIIRQPMPYRFSRLVDDPSVFQLVVINPTPQEIRRFRVSFRLYGPDGSSIASTKDLHPRMNKFDILPGQTLQITGPQVLDPDAIEYNQSIYNSVLTSNMLPEGSYTLCVSVIDSAGIPIGNPPQLCQTFTVYHPQPPALMSPCGNTLQNFLPQFVWTPVVGADPTVVIDYKIKIVKIFDGQTPRDAIDFNIPLLERVVRNTSYQYLPSDISLSGYTDVNGFAWQVQAIDAMTQEPAAGQNGKSDICVFYPPEQQPGILSQIFLISPSNNSDFAPENGLFRFTWSLSQVTVPYQAIGLKIVEVRAGQTPANAIAMNDPVFYSEDIGFGASEYSINVNNNILEREEICLASLCP
jgi:hypothetical protein